METRSQGFNLEWQHHCWYGLRLEYGNWYRCLLCAVMEMTDLGQIAARKTDRCSNNATSCRLHKRDLFELERLDLLESSTLEAIQEGSHNAKVLMAVDLIRIVVGVQLQVLK